MVDMAKEGKKAFGTHYIAGLCQVTRHTVARWIAEGKLPSFVTGGGQRRVWAKDVAAFLKEHNIPIPPELLAACGLKVLIVDDEPSVRRLVSRVLQKGYPEAEIHEAGNGFEAGHKTMTVMPALILLDVRLPGIDGMQVCRAIRSDEKLRGVRILAMSGYNIPAYREEALAAGADDFIGKPFSAVDLMRKLDILMGPGVDGGRRSEHR